MAKTLVELHGGTLAVASAGENQGSAFEMRLPLAPRMPTPLNAPETSAAAAIARHRILGFDRHLTEPADLATLHAVLRAATESRL